MKTKAKIAAWAVVAAAALVTCGPNEYSYAPLHTTGADVPDSRWTSYPIPPEAARGAVRVAMLGLEPLRPYGSIEDSTLRAIHVGIVVENHGPVAWTLDGAEQYVELDGGPILATTATVERLPRLAIPAGSTRSLDLYFPLTVGDPKKLPREVELVWTVRMGERVVTMSTWFQRFLSGPAIVPLPTTVWPGAGQTP